MGKIGFIGLGIMGRGMAMSLASAGHPLTVWNRTRSRTEGFPEIGAFAAETPRQAAEGSDVVFTMLSNPAAVIEVVEGPDGVFAGLGKGAVLIDCSTVDPPTSRSLAQAAAEKGADFLDAPVGGSKKAAAEGELVFMVGGGTDVLERVRPILDRLGKTVIHAGESGMGSQLKLCFNMIVAHMAAGLSETLIFGAKSGLDPKLILDTVNAGIIGSRFYQWKGECIIERDFNTNFSLELMHKDLNLMMKTAYDLDLPLPVTASVKELFGAAKSCCDPEEDFSAVIRALETLAHFEVRSGS